MKNILNIAVFGLSLSTLDQIKTQVLLALPSSIQVKWVNLAENKIDLLLVNDVFLMHLAFKRCSMISALRIYVSSKKLNMRGVLLVINSFTLFQI